MTLGNGRPGVPSRHHHPDRRGRAARRPRRPPPAAAGGNPHVHNLITGASVMGAVFAFASGTSDITTARPEDIATGTRLDPRSRGDAHCCRTGRRDGNPDSRTTLLDAPDDTCRLPGNPTDSRGRPSMRFGVRHPSLVIRTGSHQVQGSTPTPVRHRPVVGWNWSSVMR